MRKVVFIFGFISILAGCTTVKHVSQSYKVNTTFSNHKFLTHKDFLIEYIETTNNLTEANSNISKVSSFKTHNCIYLYKHGSKRVVVIDSFTNNFKIDSVIQFDKKLGLKVSEPDSLVKLAYSKLANGLLVDSICKVGVAKIFDTRSKFGDYELETKVIFMKNKINTVFNLFTKEEIKSSPFTFWGINIRLKETEIMNVTINDLKLLTSGEITLFNKIILESEKRNCFL